MLDEVTVFLDDEPAIERHATTAAKRNPVEGVKDFKWPIHQVHSSRGQGRVTAKEPPCYTRRAKAWYVALTYFYFPQANIGVLVHIGVVP